MKKFFKSPWTISIATAIFSFLLTVLYDLFKGKRILSTISSILNAVWTAILSFLTFNLKVWWVLIAAVIIFIVLWCFSKYYNYKDSIDKPQFTAYTRDSIQGWTWEWYWKKDIYGKYDVEGLHPICTQCDTPLVRSNRLDGSLECLRCNSRYVNQLPDFDNIQIIIIDNVRKGMYPKAGDAK